MPKLSQAEKETYLTSLALPVFEKLVVRRLFSRLGFSDGRALCSPSEPLRDCAFFDVDRIGVVSLAYVLVYGGAINLAGLGSETIAEISSRLVGLVSRSVKYASSKEAIFPSAFYVVASGRINASARSAIAGGLSNPASVKFIDRDELIVLIDKNCAEIWQDITSDVFPYLHSLSKLVEDQAVVGPTSTSIAGLKSYYAASDRAFVDLKLIKSVAKPRLESGKWIEDFKFEEGGISTLTKLRGDRLLLLGDAGAGKSTLIVRAAYLMAKEAASGKHDFRVPIILRASDISSIEADGSLVEAMNSSVEQLVGKPLTAFTEADLVEGRVVLMVDGLDELGSAEGRELVVGKLNEFCALFPRSSLVLTTRPYSSIEEIEGVRGFTRCRISSMSLASAERMITNYQGGRGQSQANEILRRIEGIHGIELNPLLVTVFALTAEQDRRDVPANITELFSKFTELMLGRWDESKGLSQQFQARIKEHVLAKFSFQLHMDRRTQFSPQEFESFALELLAGMNHQADAESLIEEIINRSGLLRSVGTSLEFRHHLIQEFFAGKGIPGIIEIKALVASEWWRNAIVFYFGTKADDVHSLLDVATSVGSGAADACLTVGLALQTCYLSKLEDKIDVWKWVVENLAKVTEQVLLQKDNEKFPILHFLTHYLIAREAVALSGIDRTETGALQWSTSGNHFATDPELRRFWAYVALSEIGKLEIVDEAIQVSPLRDAHLNLALSFGCRLIEVVRSVKGEQKQLARTIRRRLEGKVEVLKYQFAKEYRGQLLEYRRGAIVALDQAEADDEVTPND